MILTLSLLTIVIANPQQAKAWNSITDPPVNHLTFDTTISHTMFGGTKASFFINDINLISQHYEVQELFWYIPTSVLTENIYITFFDIDDVVTGTRQLTGGTSFYNNLEHIITLPVGTVKMELLYVTKETSYSYAFSMEKEWFFENAYIKNQTYIDSISYQQIWLSGVEYGTDIEQDTWYNFGYADGVEETSKDIFDNGISTYINPDTGVPYIQTNAKDYIQGYAGGKTATAYDIFNNGIFDSVIGYINPDTGLPYSETASHDYQQGFAVDSATAYNEGYNDGYVDGSTTSFMSGIDTWIVPAIIIVLIGGGFIAFAKMRNKGD